MKIVIAYKWAPNPQDASVGADGTVDWSRTKDAISDYDPQAFELGRVLADACGAELIGLSLGGPNVASPMAKKAALARGLDRLVTIADDQLSWATTTQTGLLLAQAIEQIGGVELVLCGDSSVDTGAQLVPAVIAGALGWPAFTDVTALSGQPGELLVQRVHAGGSQLIKLTVPAVLAVAADATKPRIPGMKDILAAGKKPAEALPLDQLDTTRLATSRVLNTARPQLRSRRQEMVAGPDALAAAAALLARLRTERVL